MVSPARSSQGVPPLGVPPLGLSTARSSWLVGSCPSRAPTARLVPRALRRTGRSACCWASGGPRVRAPTNLRGCRPVRPSDPPLTRLRARFARRSARPLCPPRSAPPPALRPAPRPRAGRGRPAAAGPACRSRARSEEHTSELQSHSDLVCRLLLEKKKKKNKIKKKKKKKKKKIKKKTAKQKE